MSSYGSPSRSNANTRQNSSRPHPYSRPSSTNGDTASNTSNAIVTRRGLTSSASTSSLVRSGSEPSLGGLMGGLKSILSKPLSWIATPSRSNSVKRDLSPDVEDPESPSDIPSKRIRRRSPTPPKNTNSLDIYSPNPRSISGSTRYGSSRKVSGMSDKGRESEIPQLPSNLSLTRAYAQKGSAGGARGETNFSRPLPSSQSMPYLDPPSISGSPSRTRKTGLAKRSGRLDLAAAAGTDDDMESVAPASPARYGSVKNRDFGLPSNSPFRANVPASPSRFTGGQLSKSSTMTNLARQQSVMTDVSMTSEPRRSGSMLFGSPRTESRMSVDPSDLFARGSAQPGLTPGRAAAMRNGSPGPTSTFSPIRRGPLVYAADRGFIPESELRAQNNTLVGANEAERILFALENRRNTPLQAARSSAIPFTQGGPFPHDLVGASTRQIRKAINVPLATAQTRETLKTQREKEIQEERQRGVSVVISPYGRRRQADEDLRAARAAEKAARDRVNALERERESEYRPSSERELSVPSQGRSSRRTRSISSKISDYNMDEDHAEFTPRRSARLKRGETTPEPETTPRARKSSRAKGSATPKQSSRSEATSPTDTRRSSRKRTVDRATSPTPPPAVQSIPTINEIAPSPQQEKESSGGYQPRSANDAPKERSSLRANQEKTKRTHAGAASFGSSRANTPGSGHFSAKEEDLPEMDDLEQQNKIPLNSFSGISFTPLSSAPTSPGKKMSDLPSTESPAPAEPAPTPSESGNLLGRLGPKPADSSLGVPARHNPLSRINQHKPRSSSPLASAPTNAEPESPPAYGAGKAAAPAPTPAAGGFFPISTSSAASTTTATKPPASSFFSGIGSAATAPAPPANLFGSVDAPKKDALDLGLGKPSSEPVKQAETGAVPDFFGKSQPGSGTTTPAAIAPTTNVFNFGTSAPTPPPAPLQGSADAAKKPFTGFSFGSTDAPKPADAAPATGSLFSKPADAAPLFGKSAPAADKPATNAFSFGSSSAAPTTPAAEPPKPTFDFGAKPATTAPAEPSKSTFSFGAPATSSAKAAEPAKPAFSFGATSAPKPDEAPKTTSFTFGQTNTAATPSTASKPLFGGPGAFGAPSPAATENKSTNNLFSPPSTAASIPAPSSTSSGGFSFGASATKGSTFSMGSGASTGFGDASGSSNKRSATDNADEPPAKFGSASSSTSTTAPSFSFGASGTTGTGMSGGFGAPAAATPPSSTFTFGAPAPSTPSVAPTSNPFNSTTPSSTPSFNFGATSAPAPAAPASGAPGFNFTFGAAQTAPSTPTGGAAPFQFGAPAPAASSGGFGTNNSMNGMNGSSGMNGFGASAPSNNGFGAPNSGFGAPAPSTGFGGGGGFGQSAPAAAPAPQFAFGSPAPAQQAAPGSPAGGFSMGAAGAIPGSPGTRPIKGLRKARR